MNWAALGFTALANAVLALLTATIVLIATQIGWKSKSAQTPAQPAAAVEMQGAAINSNEPLKMLIGAVEAGNVTKMEELSLKRKGSDALAELTDELNELRFELRERR